VPRQEAKYQSENFKGIKMRESLSEILEMVGTKKTRDDRIELLRYYATKPLVDLFSYGFHPDCKWLLPEGDPPYTPSDAPDTHGNLMQNIRRLYIFIEGGNPLLSQSKREMLFVQMLEGSSPGDAKLLCRLKDKKLTEYRGITYDLIYDAFPGLLPKRK
jgi:hypothetical protein